MGGQKGRPDASDEHEVLLWLLHKLAAEGWVIESHRLEHDLVRVGKALFADSATLTVELRKGIQ